MRYSDELQHAEGECGLARKALVIACKPFWQCDLLGYDGVFHIEWQMPHHVQYVMQGGIIPCLQGT